MLPPMTRKPSTSCIKTILELTFIGGCLGVLLVAEAALIVWMFKEIVLQ